MTGGFLDRKRASELMQGAGLDALVVVQPENFRYATGAHPGFPASWRRAPTQIAVVPADVEADCAIVITDAMEGAVRARSTIRDVRTHPIWTDHLDFRLVLASDPSPADAVKLAIERAGIFPASRPSTYDATVALHHLRDILDERGLANACLGIELDFIPVADMEAFRATLPQARFSNSSEVFGRLRLIKCEDEIALLRAAVDLTETAIREVTRQARPGHSANDLSSLFREAVIVEARRRGRTDLESEWTAFCCGPEVRGAGNGSAKLEPGHAIKLDCGCRLSGYTSDIARTFILGKGSPHQRALHDAVDAAWHAGFEALRPGNPLKQVHDRAQGRMREAGYTSYTRGHVGHGLGATIWNEEWPYISATAETVIEKNMVFAYEVPFYADGVGAFTIEDNVLVTESGCESMNTMPRGYCELNC
jgi:Xaa-Pro aminopeptidase